MKHSSELAVAFSTTAFSALTLLVGWQEEHPASKNFCSKTPWDCS